MNEAQERGSRQHPIIISSRSSDMVRALGLLVLAVAVVFILWKAQALVFATFLAVLFALVLSAGVTWLRERLRIPRILGTILIVAAVFGVLFALGAAMAPSLRSQARELQQSIPSSIDELEAWFRGVPVEVREAVLTTEGDEQTTAPGDDGPTTLRQQLAEEASRVAKYFFPFLSSTLAAFGGAILVLFVAVLIAVNPDVYYNGLLHLVPPARKEKAREVLSRLGFVLRRWLGAQFVSMIAVGILAGVGLWILDVRAALALALLAGLLEFIPIFGPIISYVPAVLLAFLDSPQKALWVTLLYLIINQIEGNLLMPIVMKHGVYVPPVLTIIFGALMGIVFGFLGLLVAVPIIAAVLVVVKILYVQDVVGDAVPVGGEK